MPLGGELILLLFNVLLLTLLIAPLVLWRYRHAVLSGTGVDAVALPVPHAPAPAAAAAPAADRDGAQRQRLAWERRLRRRVLAAAWLATVPPALLLAALKLYLDDHSFSRPTHGSRPACTA